MGHWSLQDMEPWACVTCTFENEPVFAACEMCGQSRPLKIPAAVASKSAVAGAMVDESVLVRQEQRLHEIRKYSNSKAPPPEDEDAKLSPYSLSPKPPRDTRRRARRIPNRNISPPLQRGSTNARGSGLAPLSGHSTLSVSSGHSTPSRSGYLSGDASLGDLFADGGSSLHFADLGSLHKPRRLLDMQDSTATAITCDMSTPSLDYPPSERLVYPKGIQEEEECQPSIPSGLDPLRPRSAEC
jgi:hypothetical protein